MNKLELTILYVEDETGIRDELSRFLQRYAKELFIAKDGQEGFSVYEKHTDGIDIVISDIKMPKMTGVAMAKKIKNLNSDQHIVFTTAHNESEYFLEAIEMSVDGYILKPVNLKRLQEKILKIAEQIELKKEYQAQQEILNEIATIQESMLFVFDQDKEIKFINKHAQKFFNVSSLEDFIFKFDHLSSCFISSEEYYCPDDKSNDNWLDEIGEVAKKKQIVVMVSYEDFEPKGFVITSSFNEKNSHTILTLTEVTNIIIETEELRKKAFYDELTKIFNRAYFNQEVIKEIANTKRNNTPFSFIIFDIDHFKKFNDTYGHRIGDDILIEMTTLISKRLRETDIFARWGGEEFVIIMTNTDLENGIKVAEQLRESIENNTFVNDLKVTSSFGVTQYKDGDIPETLLERADKALYRAKNKGRNRVEVFK